MLMGKTTFMDMGKSRKSRKSITAWYYKNNKAKLKKSVHISWDILRISLVGNNASFQVARCYFIGILFHTYSTKCIFVAALSDLVRFLGFMVYKQSAWQWITTDLWHIYVSMKCVTTDPGNTLLFVRCLTTRWRHQMESFSALLAICAGNSPVPAEFPTQRPVARNCDVLFDLRPNKLLSKQTIARPVIWDAIAPIMIS